MKRILLCLPLIWSSVVYSQNIDIRILRTINSPQTLKADGFCRFMSNSDTYVVLGIPAGMAVAGFIGDDKELVRNACVTLAAVAINQGITSALKYSINRDRPFVTYSDITKKAGGDSPSFPSGHTSSAFAAATSVSLAYPKWYVIAPSFIWAGTVGFSRMELGVHYPSDVLAGAVIGAGSAFLTYKINQKLHPRKKIPPCNCPK